MIQNMSHEMCICICCEYGFDIQVCAKCVSNLPKCCQNEHNVNNRLHSTNANPCIWRVIWICWTFIYLMRSVTIDHKRYGIDSLFVFILGMSFRLQYDGNGQVFLATDSIFILLCEFFFLSFLVFVVVFIIIVCVHSSSGKNNIYKWIYVSKYGIKSRIHVIVFVSRFFCCCSVELKLLASHAHK